MPGGPGAAALESVRLAEVYTPCCATCWIPPSTTARSPVPAPLQFLAARRRKEPVAPRHRAKVRLLLQELGPTYVKFGRAGVQPAQVLPETGARAGPAAPGSPRSVRTTCPDRHGDPRRASGHLYERFDEVPLAPPARSGATGPGRTARRSWSRSGGGCRPPGARRPGHPAQPDPLWSGSGLAGGRDGRDRWGRVRQNVVAELTTTVRRTTPPAGGGGAGVPVWRSRNPHSTVSPGCSRWTSSRR